MQWLLVESEDNRMNKMTNHQKEKLLNEILEGNFSLLQKQQIIIGAKEGIDFWKYADPEISYLQMEEIRNSMKNNVN